MKENRNKKTDKVYKETLDAIVKTIEHDQVKVVTAANTQLLWSYWNIGNELSVLTNDNEGGVTVLDTLSSDLRKRFPFNKGFSARNLMSMRQFAETYPPFHILVLNDLWRQVRSNTPQLAALFKKNEGYESQFSHLAVEHFTEADFANSLLSRMSWSHHLVLLDKCPEISKRFWYMLNTLEYGISRNILYLQIQGGVFERQIALKKVPNFEATKPKPQTDFANYLLKDPYIFDFVHAKEKADERNIEEQLSKRITQFFLDSGQGFAFVGKHYPLRVGEKDYFVDLLFYHVKLHCYVVVGLKARTFEPGDPAQLNFCCNVINAYVKTEQDNDSIGILLCKGKNETIAEYALKGYNQTLGVADYVMSKAVPENLTSTLPQIEDLEQELCDFGSA